MDNIDIIRDSFERLPEGCKHYVARLYDQVIRACIPGIAGVFGEPLSQTDNLHLSTCPNCAEFLIAASLDDFFIFEKTKSGN